MSCSHSHGSVVPQPPADDEKGSKEVSFSGPTTTYKAPSHIGENPRVLLRARASTCTRMRLDTTSWLQEAKGLWGTRGRSHFATQN